MAWKGWNVIAWLGTLRGATILTLLLLAPLFYLTLFRGLGFVADDHWHLLAFGGGSYPGGPTPSDLFRFASGDASQMRAAMQDGSASWYSDPNLKLAFFRPLSGALHFFDHWPFGAHPLVSRIHSTIWYLALVAVTFRLFSRALTTRAATLASVIFVCAAEHWQPIAWTAARNALISGTFAVGALLAYLRFRVEGTPRWSWLAAALYVLGISAGESAFGIVPYVVAYELCEGSGTARERTWKLLPFVLISLMALTSYAALGYGAERSTAYISPLSEPRYFLAELPGRVASMLAFSYLAFPADIWFLEPKLQPLSSALGLGALLWLVWLAWIVWRALEPRARRATTWLGLGALGAMVPQAGGLLGSRSLTLPSLGTSAVVALLLLGAVDKLRSAESSRGARIGAGLSAALLVVVHLVLAPASWLTTALFYGESMHKVSTADHDLDLAGSRNKRAILLQVADVFVNRYLPFERRALGQAAPKAWHSLSQAPYDHIVRRTGPKSFELEIVGGQMLETPLENLDRPRGHPLKIGDHVELDDFSVRVLDAGELGPRRIAVDCRSSLEDPTWLFLIWKDGCLEHFSFPPIGSSVRLPFSAGPTDL